MKIYKSSEPPPLTASHDIFVQQGLMVHLGHLRTQHRGSPVPHHIFERKTGSAGESGSGTSDATVSPSAVSKRITAPFGVAASPSTPVWSMRCSMPSEMAEEGARKPRSAGRSSSAPST